MIIVADTSALVALGCCQALHLLDQLFEKVAVPHSVYQECIIEGKPESDRLKKYLADKIVEELPFPSLALPAYLGKGEVDAMLLYKYFNADYLLIDDQRARKIAQSNGIAIIGSLGIILLAKKKGYINSITPLVDNLRSSDLYINEELLQHVLKLAGERD